MIADPWDLVAFADMLTDFERGVAGDVRSFGLKYVAPIINEHWQSETFPTDVIPALADLQVVGGSSAGYARPGMTRVADGLVAAELARADGSIRDFHTVHDLAMVAIKELGSLEQQERWLPSLASIEKVGAFAMTEPGHGSDAATLETHAVEDGSGWRLYGHKRWITNGTIADVVIVWARDPNGDVSAFVVEPPAVGFDARKITGKTACRAADHGDILLQGVKVPGENRLLGAKSFRDLSRLVARSRQGVAWEALGHATAAYEAALEHAQSREQFGGPLASFQLVQEKLVEMALGVTTVQLVCWRVATLDDEGSATSVMASAAKRHAAATARRVVALARELLGGDGVLLERDVTRHQLDVEAAYTYEGTHDMHTLIIGRELTGQSAFASPVTASTESARNWD